MLNIAGIYFIVHSNCKAVQIIRATMNSMESMRMLDVRLIADLSQRHQEQSVDDVERFRRPIPTNAHDVRLNQLDVDQYS